ncbi:MAG: hypothetical protein JST32_12830, partial [Bacteroidetes bacterium]|nr:hypothetical protein [Bacteroidota bacterium]
MDFQEALLRYAKQSDSLARKFQAEKIYLRFDRPEYSPGDTLWFKAYLFNAVSYGLSATSGLLHVDVVNDSNKLVKQYLFPALQGISLGDIPLSKKDFKTGNYAIRAYTNWLRNYDAQTICNKKFLIAGSEKPLWLVNSNITAVSFADKQQVKAILRLTDMEKRPVADSTLQLEVVADKKILYRQNVRSDTNGFVNVNFSIPQKITSYALLLNNGNKHISVPGVLNRPENADVQFLPEGGDLVAGLPSRIGFKAIDANGKAIEVSGNIIDHSGREVTSFRSIHNGMGSFDLLPSGNEVYAAEVKLPGGAVKDYPLPVVKASGTSIRLNNNMESDSIKITLRATEDLIRADNTYFLLVKSRELVCYGAIVDFGRGSVIRKSLPKSLFPKGIAHFILTTTQGRPLNERLAFIQHHNELKINITPDRPFYQPKDSVALAIKVTDQSGFPIPGDFAIAVTDDGQVKTDSLKQENILTRMLLTADLKSFVEAPSYYFQNSTSAWQALDDLLLTQGWVSYAPTDTSMRFEPEREYTVNGRVDNVFHKPVKGTDVLLFSKSPSILMDT